MFIQVKHIQNCNAILAICGSLIRSLNRACEKENKHILLNVLSLIVFKQNLDIAANHCSYSDSDCKTSRVCVQRNDYIVCNKHLRVNMIGNMNPGESVLLTA